MLQCLVERGIYRQVIWLEASKKDKGKKIIIDGKDWSIQEIYTPEFAKKWIK